MAAIAATPANPASATPIDLPSTAAPVELEVVCALLPAPAALVVPVGVGPVEVPVPAEVAPLPETAEDASLAADVLADYFTRQENKFSQR